MNLEVNACACILDTLTDALASLGWWHRFFVTDKWTKRQAALFMFCVYCEHLKPVGLLPRAVARAKKVLSLQNREWWELP